MLILSPRSCYTNTKNIESHHTPCTHTKDGFRIKLLSQWDNIYSLKCILDLITLISPTNHIHYLLIMIRSSHYPFLFSLSQSSCVPCGMPDRRNVHKNGTKLIECYTPPSTLNRKIRYRPSKKPWYRSELERLPYLMLYMYDVTCDMYLFFLLKQWMIQFIT